MSGSWKWRPPVRSRCRPTGSRPAFRAALPLLKVNSGGLGRGPDGLRALPEMFLVFRELRENLVPAVALAEGANHRGGRRERREREGDDADEGREPQARRREGEQDRREGGRPQE